MSDTITRVTPREIAEMILNEQAYQQTRFVLAEAHDAEIASLRARVEVLERKCRLTQIDPSEKHQCKGCYLQSRLTFDFDDCRYCNRDYETKEAKP